MTKRTPKELHRHLVARGIPYAMQDRIEAEDKARRLVERKMRAKNKQHFTLWSRLLSPLRAEIRNVRLMQKTQLKRPAPERAEALAAYMLVMDTLLNQRLLMYSKTREYTPGQLAEESNRGRIKVVVPNNGQHWVDWVPERIKLRVKRLFDAIPYRPHVHTAKPFERKVPQALLTKMRDTLLKRTLKEQEGMQIKHKINPKDLKLTRDLGRVAFALRVLRERTQMRYMPPTWHGLLTDVDIVREYGLSKVAE